MPNTEIEIEKFFNLYKKLLNPNLTSCEKYKIMQNIKKTFTKIKDDKNEEMLITQKLYVAGKIMEDKIYPALNKITQYKSEQKICRIKGRTERNRRTHQLIFIGSIWRDFLLDNNLYKYLYDAPKFEEVLNKIKNVNIAEEYKILDSEVEINTSTSVYTGRDKKIIHYYCQIGGMWEAYWRKICKNDIRDKRIFKIFKQIDSGNFDVTKIDNDKYIDFNFYCNENQCEKIGAFNNFFKPCCLKLDEKFFHEFLVMHKFEIIDALVNQ